MSNAGPRPPPACALNACRASCRLHPSRERIQAIEVDVEGDEARDGNSNLDEYPGLMVGSRATMTQIAVLVRRDVGTWRELCVLILWGYRPRSIPAAVDVASTFPRWIDLHTTAIRRVFRVGSMPARPCVSYYGIGKQARQARKKRR